MPTRPGTPIHGRRNRLAVLALCCLPLAAPGDTLSEPPDPWRDRLTAVADADLSGAEPYARQSIAAQRGVVAAALQQPGIPDSDLAEAYGRLGARYQVHGLHAAARVCYRNAMALEPGRFRWAYYAAFVAAAAGRAEDAVAGYQAARGLRPDYPPLQLRLGAVQLESGRIEDAAATLKGISGEPGLRALALYYLAQIDLLQHRYDDAVHKLETVLELDPAADAAHYPLARALRARGEDDRARGHMAERGNRLPAIDDPLLRELEALNQGARQFFAAGLRAGRDHDYAAAAAAFAQGLEIEPGNLDARVSHARALYLSGRPDEAAAELDRVLRQSPEHSLALFLSGLLLEDGGEEAGTTQRYRRVLEVEPGHYGAHFCLANWLYLAGDFGAAGDHYHAALAAHPDIPPARLYELLARKRSGTPDDMLLPRIEAQIAGHPEQQELRYALIRLLTLSEDQGVRDTERARRLVNDLVQEAFIPPHVELQALVAAALGNFRQAAELQAQVLPALLWTGGDLQDQAAQALEAYRQDRLPASPWYAETMVLRPPVTDVRLMMAEYPAAVPY